MKKPRLYLDITIKDLAYLRDLGLAEHEDFFMRNDKQGKTYLREAYHDSLVAICLCQNAATQCIYPSHGFGDFDVWLFYKNSDSVNFPYRAYKKTGKPQFKGTYVDFLKRSIMRSDCTHIMNLDGVSACIVNYLLERKNLTQKTLLRNAVIGLYPDEIFGMAIWGGKLGSIRPTGIEEMRSRLNAQSGWFEAAQRSTCPDTDQSGAHLQTPSSVYSSDGILSTEPGSRSSGKKTSL